MFPFSYCLDKIDVLEETSYSFIHDNFLIRGLPVAVSDSLFDLNQSQNLIQFIDDVTENMTGIVREEACSLHTNLMMSKYATVDETFSILRKMTENYEILPPWFLSFRNCQIQAVELILCLSEFIESSLGLTFQLKSSRLMMRKPYFYPTNLQAPSSSWILMSQNYENYQNDLNLFGLVIVTQLKGSIKITLKPKLACLNLCSDLILDLFSGESLIFLSNLWIFSYEFIPEKDFSLTFITETDFI